MSKDMFAIFNTLSFGSCDETSDEASAEYERSIDLLNRLQEVERLQPFLEEIQAALKLDDMLVMQLNLAIEEALVNVISYAYPPEVEGGIRLSVDYHADKHRLRFMLSDYGKAFDPTGAAEADVTQDAMDRPVGGLGIFLVRQLMTCVKYSRRNDCNVLLMIKDL